MDNDLSWVAYAYLSIIQSLFSKTARLVQKEIKVIRTIELLELIAELNMSHDKSRQALGSEIRRLVEIETEEVNKRAMSEEFLSNGKDEIFDLFVSVREEFDGSEYQQGKKDGLRLALALLGNPDMASFNRGGGMAREQ